MSKIKCQKRRNEGLFVDLCFIRLGDYSNYLGDLRYGDSPFNPNSVWLMSRKFAHKGLIRDPDSWLSGDGRSRMKIFSDFGPLMVIFLS